MGLATVQTCVKAVTERPASALGHVTSLFVRKMVAQVSDGIDQDDLLRNVGVDPASAWDPRQMVVDIDYYELLEKIAGLDACIDDLPLRTGASMRCSDYGAIGLAMKSATTLRHAYERAVRYAKVLTSVARYELRDGSQSTALVHHRAGERRLGLYLSNEATLASLYTLAGEITAQPITPQCVHFSHPAPANPTAHEHFFGCAVHFGAAEDSLVFEQAAMQTTSRIGDVSVSRYIDAHLDAELTQIQEPISLERRVQTLIAQSLSEGVPAISTIAGELGISGRSLQRRLMAKGQSFQGLIGSTRRRLAESLLRDSDYPLIEIAFLSGFSEQSAFQRAFRRWSGQTPGAFRLASQQPPPTSMARSVNPLAPAVKKDRSDSR